jgi:hypothetical protein
MADLSLFCGAITRQPAKTETINNKMELMQLSGMARYNERGRHDDAITVAQNWLNKHSDDHLAGTIYGQIAVSYWRRLQKTIRARPNG